MTDAVARERPILMSGEMVRAILDGRKTQTRRVVKPQFGDAQVVESRGGDGTWTAYGDAPTNYAGEVQINDWRVDFRCPFGVPGDRLWLREAWALHRNWDHLPGGELRPDTRPIWYCADYDDHRPSPFGRYRHGRFMPRWACRIVLEITDVRVQRLQDISEEDVGAEGTPGMISGRYQCDRCNGQGRNHTWPTGCPNCNGTGDNPKAKYRALWISLNGYDSWEANPWVWVLTFRRCHANASEASDATTTVLSPRKHRTNKPPVKEPT